MFVLAAVMIVVYPPVGQYHTEERGPVTFRLVVFDDFNDGFKGLGPVWNLFSIGGVFVEYPPAVNHPGLPDHFTSYIGLFFGNTILTLFLLRYSSMYWKLAKSKEPNEPESMYED